MKLIFTQGNPEPDYTGTRHNVGFTVANALAKQQGITFKSTSKFFAETAEYTTSEEKVIIAKPTTYYNETGKSLLAIKQFYKLDESDILVVHDELALPFGTLRSRIGGSDAGNNGIKSINAHGGSQTARLRVGVGNELRAQIGDTDFVLNRFSKSESEVLTTKILPASLKIIDDFVNGNFSHTTHV